MGGDFEKARSLIYKAHDEDPTKQTTADGKEVPYETHYAQKMEKYLQQRSPNASDILKLAICAQHLHCCFEYAAFVRIQEATFSDLVRCIGNAG